MSSEPSGDTEIPARTEVDGRGEGQGWWLEQKAQEAFDRWGLRTARNGRVWVQEVDVVASRETGARYLAECKDYQSAHVTPRDVWRLIALSLTVGARPVLIHSSPLTDGAAEICRYWRVVRIPVGDVLFAEEMPRPSRPRREMGDNIRGNNWNPKWQDEGFRRTIIGKCRKYERIERKPDYYPRG